MEQIEDSIYMLVAGLLVVAGAFLLWSAATTLVSDLTHAADPLGIVLTVLDKGLVLFIIAELLHTVRITIVQRTLAAEPFLIVGVIAGIRRLLVLTAQTAEKGFHWNPEGIELALLTFLVLAMTAAVLLWHRFYHSVPEPDEQS